MKGSCQCGAVTCKVSGTPMFIYACHCHICQKRTGSAFSMGSVYPEDALAVHGELSRFVRTSDAGETNARFNCACCGNVIYGVGTATPGVIKLQTGTLDNTAGMQPSVHRWIRHAQPWIVFPEDARCFEAQPDSVAQLLQS